MKSWCMIESEKDSWELIENDSTVSQDNEAPKQEESEKHNPPANRASYASVAKGGIAFYQAKKDVPSTSKPIHDSRPLSTKNTVS